MTAINYCYEKIAMQGSPLYYCVKKISTDKRDAVVAIAAFYEEILDIVLHETDPEVTYKQLDWWRSELIKIVNGLPDHPIARALQEYRVDPHSLLNIMNGLEEKLSRERFDTFETTIIHIMRTAGARELLIADILQLKISQEIIFQSAMVLELVEYIQCLRQYVRRDCILFPQDEMQRFQVTEHALREYKTTSEIVNLLKCQAEKIKRAYYQVREELNPLSRNDLGYLLSRCDIAEKTLQQLEQSGFAVLENFIQLTPLRMWWIAYRAR